MNVIGINADLKLQARKRRFSKRRLSLQILAGEGYAVNLPAFVNTYMCFCLLFEHSACGRWVPRSQRGASIEAAGAVRVSFCLTAAGCFDRIARGASFKRRGA